MLRSRIGVLLATGVLFADAGASALTLNPGFFGSDLIVTAEDGVNPGLGEVIRNPVAVPYQTTEAATDGAASASADFDLSDAGFAMDFDLAEQGGGSNGWAVSQFRIYFAVDAPTGYEILGAYSALDPDGGGASLGFELHDATAGVYLFSSYQDSLSTPNESFVVGGSGGDSGNLLAGSAVGTLLPGHEYSFFAYARIEGRGTAQPGTATGFAGLVLVPEPASGLLLAAGMLALARGRRGPVSLR